MAKGRGAGSAPSKTATASTAAGELQRHLADLKLNSAEAYRAWCREHGFSQTLDKGWRERRTERLHAEKLRTNRVALASLADHLKALGVDGEAEYYRWCHDNGFAESLNKRPRQRADELLALSRQRAATALTSARQFDRRPEDLVRAIAAGAVEAESLRAPHLRAIHEAFQAAGPDASVRGALLELLHCRAVSRLLTADQAIAHLGPRPGNSYIAGLLALSLRRADWLRPPHAWTPDSQSARRQFSALARHLLARYEVPSFMDACWFLGGGERASRRQDWFLHIASGRNIRTADIPLRLTKRAAHLFLQAPRDLPIEAALRWAQARALGGDEPLARALLATRLAELQEDEPFWQSVIFFFINNPMLDFGRIGAIVDYVHSRRFVAAEITGPNGEPAGMAIPEPGFSMKGRTGIALLRRVEEWHRELARESKRAPLEWPPSGIGGFAWSYRDTGAKLDVTWTIDEILSSRGLQEEGKDMRHCVASYASACARGSSSIWTLQVQEGAGAPRRRVMTIELQNARRTISQARGRCNKTPGEKRASVRLSHAPDIVRHWAEQQKLTVPAYLFNR
jgi:hypothetical protein